MLSRFVKNYIERHQVLGNQVLHLAGVPLTFIVSIVLLARGEPTYAAGAFVGGYVLQFLGHAIEGNDAGELILVKKLLGRPYREFRPGYEPRSSSPEPPSQSSE
jgi:uncharacterized membrane protein YGL010W